MTLLEYIHNNEDRHLYIDTITKDADLSIPLDWDKNECEEIEHYIKHYGCILNAKINVIYEDHSLCENSLFSIIEIIDDVDQISIANIFNKVSLI